MSNRKKVYFKTFGCRTNIFDTQVMINNIDDFNVVYDENKADIIVINSCTVTNNADVSARSYINQVKKKNKNVELFFTGCGAQTKGESLFKEKKVQSVFGHSEKEDINNLLRDQTPFFKLGDLKHLDTTIVEDFAGKSRAFIKIQEGCSFRCNYCIIPYVRGDSRSYDDNMIIKQIEKLALNGFGEFILTGTNLGSYGKGSVSFAKLLSKIGQIRGVRRIRLGSIEPIQITDEFKELLDEPWLGKHLHIALQHSNNEMLSLMNRRNRLKSDLELFEFLSNKGYALGTDFIVGHPGETTKRWLDAMENIEKFPLTHLHGFTYSKRDGTPSASMKPEIRGDIAKKRLAELMLKVEYKNKLFRLKQKNLDILVEEKKNGLYTGYDQYFNRIHIKSNEDLIGNWVNIKHYNIGEKENNAIFK